MENTAYKIVKKEIMGKLAHNFEFQAEKQLVLLRNRLKDFKDWLIFDLLKLQNLDFPNEVHGLEAKIYFNKKSNSYCIQAKDYPEIYTAANSLKELTNRFHDVVNYYFENSRYITKKLNFRMNFTEELIARLKKEGVVNVSPKFSPAFNS